MHGYFYDQVEREVETSFLPWLVERVSGSLNQTSVAHAILDGEAAGLSVCLYFSLSACVDIF